MVQTQRYRIQLSRQTEQICHALALVFTFHNNYRQTLAQLSPSLVHIKNLLVHISPSQSSN